MAEDKKQPGAEIDPSIIEAEPDATTFVLIMIVALIAGTVSDIISKMGSDFTFHPLGWGIQLAAWAGGLSLFIHVTMLKPSGFYRTIGTARAKMTIKGKANSDKKIQNLRQELYSELQQLTQMSPQPYNQVQAQAMQQQQPQAQQGQPGQPMVQAQSQQRQNQAVPVAQGQVMSDGTMNINPPQPYNANQPGQSGELR